MNQIGQICYPVDDFASDCYKLYKLSNSAPEIYQCGMYTHDPIMGIDGCERVYISTTEQPASPEIDYGQLAQFWGAGFTTVLFLFFVSFGIGQILRLIKYA